MFHNIVGVYADKLDNTIFKIDNFEVNKTSFTTYFEGKILHDFISREFDEIEKNTNLQEIKLNELGSYISLVPKDFVDIDVYEYRLESLKKLYFISNEISTLLNNEMAIDNVQQKVEELSALIKVSNHGPLRNLLEEKIIKIKEKLEPCSKNKVNAENVADFINNAHSAEEIEEIFCELFIEEYVNIAKEGRGIVAKQFFELSKQYRSNTEIKSDLDDLIKKFKKEAQNKPLSFKDSEPVLQNKEFNKQTLNLKDLEKILQ
jgi:hypothetical protein